MLLCYKHYFYICITLSQEEINRIIESTTEIELADDEELNEPSIYVSKELQEQRYETCKSCPSFTVLKTRKECGCIMPLKIKLSNSACPLEKW